MKLLFFFRYINGTLIWSYQGIRYLLLSLGHTRPILCLSFGLRRLFLKIPFNMATCYSLFNKIYLIFIQPIFTALRFRIILWINCAHTLIGQVSRRMFRFGIFDWEIYIIWTVRSSLDFLLSFAWRTICSNIWFLVSFLLLI